MVGMVGILKNPEEETPSRSASRSVLRSVLPTDPPPVSGVTSGAAETADGYSVDPDGLGVIEA